MKHSLSYYIKNNYLVRNVVLAFSVLIIFLILVFVFLDIYTRHGQSYVLPNLSGLTIDQANELTKDMDLRLVVSDSLFIPSQKGGAILDQNPKPGNNVKSKRTILLTVNSFTPKQVTVPYVAGFSLRQAKNKLVAAGLEIGKIIYEPDIATNNVISQRLNGTVISKSTNTTANIGDKIDLVVGINAQSPRPVVPNVIGKGLVGAKSVLWETGINIKDVVLDQGVTYANIDEVLVIAQSLPFGVSVDFGSELSIMVTTDIEKISKAKEAAEKRVAKLKMINDQIIRYKDTLSVIRTLKKDDTFEGVNASDSLYYIIRIEELKSLLHE